MTKVAIWCRHIGDNLIGVGGQLPWCVPSDSLFFQNVIAGQNTVVGRKTYESSPAEVWEKSNVWVVTSQAEYEVYNPKTEKVVADLRSFKEFEEDLYISGGAQIYEAFLSGGNKLKPDIIVDCVYQGVCEEKSHGEKIAISACVDIMQKSYVRVSAELEKDGVCASLWVKKNEFVEQAVLKRLLLLMEQR